MKIESLSASLNAIGSGIKLDSNASIMLKYDNGASGLYWASQVAHGHKNALKVRVYGTKGSLELEQEYPDQIKIHYKGKPMQTLFRGRDQLYPQAAACIRIPGGHPEGTYEAFANIYKNFANMLLKKLNQEPYEWNDTYYYPDVTEGVQGVKFIDKCLDSHQKGSTWVSF